MLDRSVWEGSSQGYPLPHVNCKARAIVASNVKQKIIENEKDLQQIWWKLCNGVYADVLKKESFDIVNRIKNVKTIEKIYENYKQGFQYDIDYEAKLGSGKKIASKNLFSFKLYYMLQ